MIFFLFSSNMIYYYELYVSTVRILILTTRGEANSAIFNKFIYADGFAKLLSVLEQQLKVLPLSTRADYAPHLRPMIDVLSMLLRVYESTDRRVAVAELACVILHTYRDVSFLPGDAVEGVLGDAATVLELLLECCGKLSFDTATNEYTTTVSLTEERISEMKTLLSGMLRNDKFCVSVRTAIGLADVSLPTAGKICRLLRCLLFFHERCRDPSSSGNAVVDSLFPTDPAMLLANMMRLLSKEADEAALNATALGRMCSIMNILSQLSPVSSCLPPHGGPASPGGGGGSNPHGNTIASYDSALSRCVLSLKQWAAGLPAADSVALSAVKALLRTFIDDASKVVGHPDPAQQTPWPATSIALCGLKDSVRLLVTTISCSID